MRYGSKYSSAVSVRKRSGRGRVMRPTITSAVTRRGSESAAVQPVEFGMSLLARLSVIGVEAVGGRGTCVPSVASTSTMFAPWNRLEQRGTGCGDGLPAKPDRGRSDDDRDHRHGLPEKRSRQSAGAKFRRLTCHSAHGAILAEECSADVVRCPATTVAPLSTGRICVCVSARPAASAA